MPYELVAVLKEVGADLTAGAGESMQGIEVNGMGYLGDDAGVGFMVSCIRKDEETSFRGSLRIASQSSGKRVEIGIRSFFLDASIGVGFGYRSFKMERRGRSCWSCGMGVELS